MKRFFFSSMVLLLLLACTPGVYSVYDKYKQDPNFGHTKFSGELLQLASFMVPKEQKATRTLLKAVRSVDIVNYTGKDNLGFQGAILHSLKKGGYKEVLKNNSKEKGTIFFVKKGLTRVREFHVLNYKGGNVSVFSIDGRFSIGDLESIYNLVKKQKNIKDFIDNFDLKNRHSKNEEDNK